MQPVRATSDDRSIIIEGAFLAERAAAAGLGILDIACVPARESWARETFPDAAAAGLVRILPEAGLAEVAGYPFHRGILVRAARPAACDLASLIPTAGPSADAERRPLVLWLPDLNDPENLGACFRNAAALGASFAILGPTAPDPLSPRVLRVSMGASLSLPWAREPGIPAVPPAPGAPHASAATEHAAPEHAATLSLLRQAGFRVAACVLAPDAVPLERWAAALDPEQPVALVLGNEAYGLRPDFAGTCDDRVTLPMAAGTDSLNVATAAAIFMYRLGARTNAGIVAPRQPPA